MSIHRNRFLRLGPTGRARRPFSVLAAGLAALCLVSCASSGVVRSGSSAVHSTGLSVTLVSWKDGADLGADRAASGRWLAANVRVDYDGNAQAAQVPVSDLRLRWEAPGGSKGFSMAVWVYDPTPGMGWAAGREALRVKVTNRFTLAFDVPDGAVPVELDVGGKPLPLIPPETGAK